MVSDSQPRPGGEQQDKASESPGPLPQKIISMENIDLEEFQSQVVVRQMQPDDFERIVQLQVVCFPKMAPWTRDQFNSQLRIFPEGQFCVEYDQEVVASCSSLIIDFEEYDETHSWREIANEGYITNHDPEGDTLYGIEIMVHPDYRGMKLARRLYEARKELVRSLNLKRIVIGGRIPGYVQHKDQLRPREYVEKVMDRSLFDPVLTVQLSNGFQLKRLIPDYIGDEDSAGYATLCEWVNLDYEPDPNRKTLPTRQVRACVVQYQMRPVRDFDEFAQQCRYFVDVASGYKSDFVLFPEIFTLQLLSFVEAATPAEGVRKLAGFTPQYIELFSEFAIKYNINIIGGSHFTLEEDKLYNVAYLFKRNGGIEKQAKLHITPSEKHWWGVQPGHRINVFETDRGKIAILICYDIEFPEVARIAAEHGAQIIFVPFCTDERCGYLRVRYCSQARAIENQVYVAIAGTVGNLPFVDNMDIQYAQSGIFTPSDIPFPRDAVAAECSPNIETVIFHDVDLELIRRHRRRGNVMNWKDRRTDLYEVRVKRDE
jgi:predicted amidohydrolase/ribosomal protein S18 acetylase RimI-like enzyme